MDFIGAGGWSYFRVPGEAPLAAYARAFRFVEVNATFYRHPAPRAVEAWRRRVPEDFVFSVKCHRAVTHTESLAPTEAALDAFGRSLAIAHRLRAPAFVLETPASLLFTAAKARDLTSLLASADRRGIAIALEARAHAVGDLPPPLERAMRDLGLVDATDYSRQRPRVSQEVAYTRLLGKGSHNQWVFSDGELREIAATAQRTETDRVFFTFHGVRMYRDAARFLALQDLGRFPAVSEEGQSRLPTALGPSGWPRERRRTC